MFVSHVGPLKPFVVTDADLAHDHTKLINVIAKLSGEFQKFKGLLVAGA